MAKRKKKTTHRRHRVRGFGSATKGLGHKLMKLAGIVVGSTVATVAQRRIPFNGKIVGGAMALGGLYMEDHARNPFMQGAAQGVTTAGALAVAHEFHIIAGVDEFVNGIDAMDGMYDDRTRLDGVNNTDYVQGIRNEDMLNGVSSASASM